MNDIQLRTDHAARVTKDKGLTVADIKNFRKAIHEAFDEHLIKYPRDEDRSYDAESRYFTVTNNAQKHLFFVDLDRKISRHLLGHADNTVSQGSGGGVYVEQNSRPFIAETFPDTVSELKERAPEFIESIAMGINDTRDRSKVTDSARQLVTKIWDKALASIEDVKSLDGK